MTRCLALCLTCAALLSGGGSMAAADQTIDIIDADKLARVARFLVYLAYSAANDPARPGWLAGGLAAGRAAVQ